MIRTQSSPRAWFGHLLEEAITVEQNLFHHVEPPEDQPRPQQQGTETGVDSSSTLESVQPSPDQPPAESASESSRAIVVSAADTKKKKSSAKAAEQKQSERPKLTKRASADAVVQDFSSRPAMPSSATCGSLKKTFSVPGLGKIQKTTNKSAQEIETLCNEAVDIATDVQQSAALSTRWELNTTSSRSHAQRQQARATEEAAVTGQQSRTPSESSSGDPDSQRVVEIEGQLKDNDDEEAEEGGVNKTRAKQPKGGKGSKKRSVVRNLSLDIVEKMNSLAAEALPVPAKQQQGGKGKSSLPSSGDVGELTIQMKKLQDNLDTTYESLRLITMERDVIRDERDAAIERKELTQDETSLEVNELKIEASAAADELQRMTKELSESAKDKDKMAVKHMEEMERVRSEHKAMTMELKIAKEELAIAKRNAAHEQSEDLLDLQEEVKDLEDECQAQQTKNELLEEKIKVMEYNLQQQSGELAKAKADLAAKDDELKDLRYDMKLVGSTRADAELDDIRRRYRVLEEENGNLSDELEIAAKEAETARRELKKAQHQVEEMEKEYTELKTKSNQSDVDTRELRAQVTKLQLEKVALADEVSELGEQLDESFQLFAVKTAECTTVSEELQKLMEHVDQTDLELEAAHEELAVAKGQLRLLERENKTLKRRARRGAAKSKATASQDTGDVKGDEEDYSSDSADEGGEDMGSKAVRRSSSLGALEGLAGLFGKQAATIAAAEERPTSPKSDAKKKEEKGESEKDKEIENLRAELEKQKAVSQIESSRSKRAIDQLTFEIEDLIDKVVDLEGTCAGASASVRLQKDQSQDVELDTKAENSSDTGSSDSFTKI